MSSETTHPKEPKIDVTIVDEKGKNHHITPEVIGAAYERGENYAKALQEYESQVAPLCDKDEGFDAAYTQLLQRHHLPDNVWFPHEAEDRPSVEDVTAQMAEFANGTLDNFAKFYSLLDDVWDIDPTYLLFGIPIKDLSPEQQEELCELGEHFGCWRQRELPQEASV